MITELQAYPYTAGQRFVDALCGRGGPDGGRPRSADGSPPRPSRSCTPIEVPGGCGRDGGRAGLRADVRSEWRDHDVMVVGEVWLQGAAEPPTRRGCGGVGRRAGGTAGSIAPGATVMMWRVVMSTVWDTAGGREGVRDRPREVDRRCRVGSGLGLVLKADGTRVHAGFASSQAVMGAVSRRLAVALDAAGASARAPGFARTRGGSGGSEQRATASPSPRGEPAVACRHRRLRARVRMRGVGAERARPLIPRGRARRRRAPSEFIGFIRPSGGQDHTRCATTTEPGRARATGRPGGLTRDGGPDGGGVRTGCSTPSRDSASRWCCVGGPSVSGGMPVRGVRGRVPGDVGRHGADRRLE